MDSFVFGTAEKVTSKMADFSRNGFSDEQSRNIEPVNEKLTGDEDLIMEQILENINNTPIGQVLKKIASLPEVRRGKILDVRRQITEGKYDLNERLDVALDKVLEDLTT